MKTICQQFWVRQTIGQCKCVLNTADQYRPFSAEGYGHAMMKTMVAYVEDHFYQTSYTMPMSVCRPSQA